MVFILIILALTIAKGMSFAPVGQFNTNYLSKENTTAIKGIFTILVFMAHYTQYVSLTYAFDTPYLSFKSHIGQMVVAMFLFYSGYGMMEAIKTKGFDYVKTLPTKRFLSVLINFDIAVLLFLILDFILGISYKTSTYYLAFIGWSSIGNSNWYIFVILILYLLMFISFLVIKWLNNNGGRLIGVIILTILTIIFVYWQMVIGRDSWTYNTAILLPLGCWYSLFKPQIEKLFMKNDYVYFIICTLFLVAYFYFFSRSSQSIYNYTLYGFAFTFLVVLFTMKVSIGNSVLEWFGNHVFSFYILQRIPMIILNYFGLAQSHRYMFFVISFISTVCLSLVFDYYTGKLNNLLFNKRKKGVNS